VRPNKQADQHPTSTESSGVDHSTTGAPVHGPVARNRNVGASDGRPAVVTDREGHPRREHRRYHLGSAEEASNPRMVEPFEDFMRRERKPVVGLLYGALSRLVCGRGFGSERVCGSPASLAAGESPGQAWRLAS